MDSPQTPDGALDAQAIIDRARSSIEAYRRLMADAGLTHEACIEALRQTEGDAAVQRVQREASKRMQAHNEQVARDIAHASPGRPISRKVARRNAV
jgi:hypothetical protein